MFWHSLLTISLISSQRIWSLPFPDQWQASRGQLLETMNLQDIVRIVGPRHEPVLPGSQPKSGHHSLDLKFLENIGIPTEYYGQVIHLLQLDLDEDRRTHHDLENVPLLHLPSGNAYEVLQGAIIIPTLDIGLGIQSGSPDESPLVQVPPNAGGILSLLPPGILDVPGYEFTPEQMEEIAETGRLCTEDGECVYFSGGWGEACCPFG